MKTTTAMTLVLAALAGCDRPADQGRRTDEEATATAPINPAFAGDIAAGNRAFGLALYKQLASRPGNVFISPIGIAGAFGPVIAGAEGETRTAIARALRFPGDGGPALHPELGRLLRGLERNRDGALVSIADALWVQRGFAIKPAFARTARDDYDAVSETLDFAAAPAAAAARINGWVAGETRGRIPTLFAPDAFTVDTRLVVTNAVYFLGDWKDPFDKASTSPQLFHLVGGGARSVPLMARGGSYRSIGNEAFQAIDLPYKDERLSMTVFLPRARDGLPAFEAGLTPERLAGWLGELDAATPDRTELYLPRLEISEEYDLVGPLGRMGMGVAFTPAADFRGIADADLYIDQVVHKTFVRMDEEGVEAAAATGAVVVQVSMPPVFRADHPFFFLLRDKASGAILFMGRIADLGTGTPIAVPAEAGGPGIPPPPPPAPPPPPPPARR